MPDTTGSNLSKHDELPIVSARRQNSPIYPNDINDNAVDEPEHNWME